MTDALILPRALVQDLFHHAQSSPEAEVCGLIAGCNGQQLRPLRIRNTAIDPGQRFHMDEAEQASALKAIREAGETLFAIYHSHPSAPAIPSVTDLEEVGYPDVWQLIISLNTKGVLELRAWRLAEGKVSESLLRIIED